MVTELKSAKTNNQQYFYKYYFKNYTVHSFKTIFKTLHGRYKNT